MDFQRQKKDSMQASVTVDAKAGHRKARIFVNYYKGNEERLIHNILIWVQHNEACLDGGKNNGQFMSATDLQSEFFDLKSGHYDKYFL